MIETFEDELNSRGMTYEEVAKYFDSFYMFLANLIFVPIQLFSIIQAFIPFERTTGYYDLGECLTIGVFLAIFIEIMKRVCFKIFGGLTSAMALVNLENAYNNDKELGRVALDKIKKKIDKKKKD